SKNGISFNNKANDELPYFTVVCDVSVKYKGTFCKAKIKKITRVVKCK
ncbi:hypothetical protein CEXT_764001, partial [Caerostris extrusa]